jgi:hypothetical protein
MVASAAVVRINFTNIKSVSTMLHTSYRSTDKTYSRSDQSLGFDMDLGGDRNKTARQRQPRLTACWLPFVAEAAEFDMSVHISCQGRY